MIDGSLEITQNKLKFQHSSVTTKDIHQVVCLEGEGRVAKSIIEEQIRGLSLLEAIFVIGFHHRKNMFV